MTSPTAPMPSPSQPVKQPPAAPPPEAPYGGGQMPPLQAPGPGGRTLPSQASEVGGQMLASEVLAAGGHALPGEFHIGGRVMPGEEIDAGRGVLPDTSDLDALPLLDEVPELGALLEELRQVDRIIASAVSTLARFEDTGLVEAATGIDIDHWLAIVARRTHSDIRMLHLAVATSRRVPHLTGLFYDGKLSWAQMRAVCLRLLRVPHKFDQLIDNDVTYELTHRGGLHPENAVHLIGQVIASYEYAQTEDPREDSVVRERFLALQPRLDGTGGLIHGDADALSFATIDAALSPSRGELDDRTVGQQRLDRLVDLCDSRHVGNTTADGTGTTSDPEVAESPADDASDATGEADRPDAPAATEPRRSGGMRSRPQLLVRLPIGTLLDRDQMPADLLTSLLGGTMHVNASTARTLLNERGADLRTILIDDGAIVGVGQRTRVAPGWLADATLALHDTCSAPGCRTAARICDIDHATPWTPTGPAAATHPDFAPVADQPPDDITIGARHGGDTDIAQHHGGRTDTDPHRGGRTDIDELAPVCGPHNRAKESDGWQVQQQADGTRVWHHPRTGLTTTTIPATWRAPANPNAPP